MIDAKLKAELYAFLSSVFLLGPSEDQVKGLRAILRILKIPPLSPFSLEGLKREYLDLFSVPNQRYVRPYESVYRDRIPIEFAGNPELGTPARRKYMRGLLMGKSARDVLRCYKAVGVYPSRELPDHIGNELSFLGYLAEREGTACREEAMRLRKSREDFIRRHPLKWIGKLEKEISKHDRTGYYTRAVSVAHAVLLG